MSRLTTKSPTGGFQSLVVGNGDYFRVFSVFLRFHRSASRRGVIRSRLESDRNIGEDSDKKRSVGMFIALNRNLRTQKNHGSETNHAESHCAEMTADAVYLYNWSVFIR